MIGVFLAVVVEAVELQVCEVGGSAAAVPPVVVGLARRWRSSTAGFLTVFVAGDERPPLGGSRARSAAADVEDLGLPGDDDPTERAVAQQHLEQVRREVPATSELGARLFDDPALFIEVHDGGDVRADAVDFAELAALEGGSAEVREGVHAPGAGGAFVVRVMVAGHLGFERGLDDVETERVAGPAQVAATAEGLRQEQAAGGVVVGVAVGAAVVVDGVARVLHSRRELFGRLCQRLVEECLFRGGERVGAFVAVGVGKHFHMAEADVAGQVRLGDVRQAQQCAGEVDVVAGNARVHPRDGGKSGRGGQESVDGPVAGAVPFAEVEEPARLDAVYLRALFPYGERRYEHLFVS